mmetsp:Transcript_42427/g.96016  ORF Transcript_42427/g.96016 Transcript_42427/m.96016 type:complete len:373 (+) Transcript_42427:93-1211(+)
MNGLEDLQNSMINESAGKEEEVEEVMSAMKTWPEERVSAAESKSFTKKDTDNSSAKDVSQGRCGCQSLVDKATSFLDPLNGIDFSDIDLTVDESNLFESMESDSGLNFLNFQRPPSCVLMTFEAARLKASAPEVSSPDDFFASLSENTQETTSLGFISAHSAVVTWHCRNHLEVTDDSMQVWLRPLVGSDCSTLSEGLTKLSDRSRFFRFLRPVKSMTLAQMSRCCELGDYDEHFAFGLCVKFDEVWLGVGVGSFVKETDKTRAEVAITINDGWQGLGLASLLGFTTAHAAFARGVATLTGIHHADNSPVARHLKSASASGVKVSTHRCSDDRGITEIEVSLPIQLAPGALPLSSDDFDLVAAAAAGQAPQL